MLVDEVCAHGFCSARFGGRGQMRRDGGLFAETICWGVHGTFLRETQRKENHSGFRDGLPKPMDCYSFRRDCEAS